jgi:hypothetical protein
LEDDKGKLKEVQRKALLENGELVIRQVLNIVSSLVPPLFIELTTITQQDQCAQRAEAQLEAVLKKKLTQDMSKALKATLAA